MKPRNKNYTLHFMLIIFCLIVYVTNKNLASPHSLSNVCIPQLPLLGLK